MVRIVLFLSRNEIEALSEFRPMAEAIQKSYIAVTRGEASIPPIGYLPLKQHNGDCHIKFGHLDGDPIFIVKVATGFYDNPKLGLSTSNGMMVAFSAITGEPIAILQDEGYLTDLRTAIGSAIATQALARKDATKILVVGAGIQARQQILAHKELMSEIKFGFSVWARDVKKAQVFIHDLKKVGCEVALCADLETGCGEADIILTTTPSRVPIIKNGWVTSGTHITASGADAPGKCELDEQLVLAADVRVADKIDQCLDHGEFSRAFEANLIITTDCVELGDVLANNDLGRQTNSQITIADLTGLASQDIAAARTILEAKGII